ncbi:hypothetical protein [Streptomyces sp. NPDC059759]|uniref:hypothetical protein n=1 Tax=Streptomyces sp. NPDC059759 TaxID=3346936 RepID=UPI00365C35BF
MSSIAQTSTPTSEQVFAGIAATLVVEAGKMPDPQATLAKIVEVLPVIVPEVLARAIGEREAEPGHYPWCAPGECISAVDDEGVTCVEHNARSYTTTISDNDGQRELRLIAQLGHDDVYSEAPTVNLYDEAGAGVFLGAPDLDQTIVQLDGLVSLLRVLRKQMDMPKAADDQAAGVTA